MEEILIAILQFLFEFIFNILLHFPFELSSKNRTTCETERALTRCLGWALLGVIIGFISLFFFEHSLISISALRVLNFVIAPIASGFISFAIAKRWSEANDNINPIYHFWKAFIFTFAFVLIRFIFATR